MRRLLLAAAGLALLVPVAMAQTPGAPGMAGSAPPPPPPEGPHGGPHGGPGMKPPPPSRAAHFRIGRGDAVVDVKCADEDSTKACADIVNGMLDRLASLPAGPAPARN